MWKRMTLGLIAAVIAGLTAGASRADAQSWTPRADLPGSGRHHPVTFVLNGYGYAATGTTTMAGYSNDFYRYDPVANSWQTLPNFPGPGRSYAYGGSHDGKGYLGFGRGTSYLADLWQYDPGTGQWTPLASCPGSPRMHPAFVITDDGKIFVGMGNNATGNLRDWWEYSIASNQWTQRADLPGPARHHPYYFNIGNVPYVGFGHGTTVFKDVYRFDPVGLTWTRLADFPGSARLAGTQFSYGGRGYILSGEGPGEVMLPTGEFWAYHPADDTWFQLPPHPGSGRWAPGSFIIGDNAYVLAGQSTTGLERSMWMFDMRTSTGVDDPAAAAPGSPFMLSPNPATGSSLQLSRVPDGFEATRVELFGADGRRVPGLRSQGLALELPPALGAGPYFVRFTGPGGAGTTRKIIVVR